MSADRYDVIVIGSGAGGGTLAHRLAPSGKHILILERGEYLPRKAENWNTEAVFAGGRYKAGEPGTTRTASRSTPGIHSPSEIISCLGRALGASEYQSLLKARSLVTAVGVEFQQKREHSKQALIIRIPPSRS